MTQNQNGTLILETNPYAWSKLANILFIDQPVGTGYSTTSSDGLASNQTQIVRFFQKIIIEK